jgi:predicted glycoside hydrolase/deacetylase ChbG (UPF0249 family)
MANGCANSQEELSKLKNLNVSIGVHLNISTGWPVDPSTTNSPLVTQDGSFKENNKNTKEALLNTLRIGAIQKEFDAQVESVKGLGVTISHLDTHHHVAKTPTITYAMARCARKHGIRCVRAPASFRRKRSNILRRSIVKVNEKIFKQFCLSSPILRFGLAKQSTWDQFINTFAEWIKTSPWQPGCAAELNCHPSFCDGVLGQSQEMATRRLSDLNILSDERLPELFDSLKIRLITYYDL